MNAMRVFGRNQPAIQRMDVAAVASISNDIDRPTEIGARPERAVEETHISVLMPKTTTASALRHRKRRSRSVPMKAEFTDLATNCTAGLTWTARKVRQIRAT